MPTVSTQARERVTAETRFVNGDTIDDVFLVVRSQSGDRAAFEQLVRRTSRLIYSRIYLDLGGGDAHRTEDLVQETFLTAWRSIGQVTEPSGFRTWLLSVARTVTLDAIRHESRKKRSAARRQGLADAAAQLKDAADTPPEAIEREESRRRVREMLARLPQEYAMPLTLRYIGGADYDTIGRQLGLSNGSLRGLLNRGMNKLREMMQQLEGHGSRVTGHSQGPGKRAGETRSEGLMKYAPHPGGPSDREPAASDK